MQLHWLGTPLPPQVCGAGHAGPQLTVPPHPLEMVPQFWPAPHVVSGVQPHWLGVPPPPQVCGAVHAGPQVTVPPHPLEMVPQF